MEKIQISGFFLQEIILSTIYIVAAVQYLNTSLSHKSRSIMYQLFIINIIIVGLDIATLVLEAMNLFVMQTTLKPFFYSVKLKLELAILSRLVDVVGGPTESPNNYNSSRRSSTVAFVNTLDRDRSRKASVNSGWKPFANRKECEDISAFVDVEKISGDFTRAVSVPIKSSMQRKVMLHDGLVSDTDIVAPKVGVTFVEALSDEK